MEEDVNGEEAPLDAGAPASLVPMEAPLPTKLAPVAAMARLGGRAGDAAALNVPLEEVLPPLGVEVTPDDAVSVPVAE
jgi:hypothetical protein